jgi:tetratricopeptide (TPR) repeat protein
LHESVALWRQVGNPRGLIFAYTNLGTAALALGKMEEALGYAEKSLALSAEVNDRWSEANALKLIAQAQTARSGYEGAHHSFHESIALYRNVEDHWGAAQALVDLGNVAIDAGQVEQAKAAFLEALPAAAHAQVVATGLSALVGLARIEAAGERPEWAYALAAYVAAHPQANEYAREAAGQVLEEIEGRVSGQKRDTAAGRFQGSPFDKVVGSVLGGNL